MALAWSRALRSRLVRNQIARASAPWPRLQITQIGRRSFMSGHREDPTKPREGDIIAPELEAEDIRVGRHEHRSAMKSVIHAGSNERAKNMVPGQVPPGELGPHRVFGDKDQREALMQIASRKVERQGKFNYKIIQSDLEWLQDPDSLARHTTRLLENGKVERAAEMVREAQRRHIKCIAAWNRIFTFCVKLGHVKPALRFFNDMKKRGGKPNQQTFSILLSGLRNSPPIQGVKIMQVAEELVKTMSAGNSEVTPNIIHMSALISVCPAHGTQEDMWRIAGELPEEGPLAPDTITYSTILHAIREFAERDIETMTSIENITTRKNMMILEAKRLWTDVLHRWTHDGFVMDNALVQAFASVLLEGTADHDYYDVLALYNQTMGIPIKMKEPPQRSQTSNWMKKEMKRMIETKKRTGEEEDVPFVDERNLNLQGEKKPWNDAHLEDQPLEEDENFDSLFNPIKSGNDGPQLLHPESRDLTMIEHACLSITQGMAAGIAYWEDLTSAPGEPLVVPNKFATTQYLRLLRLSRASKRSLEVLRAQKENLAEESGTAFRIGISCCSRDKKNWSAFVHANEMMNLMDGSLVLPDQRVVEAYIAFINDLSQQPGLLIHTKGLGVEFEKDKLHTNMQTLGKKLVVNLQLRALETLRPHIVRADEAFQHGTPKPVGRRSASIPAEWIAGDKIVKNMARVGQMVGDVLKTENAIFISKEDRKVVEADSVLLGRYSGRDILKSSRRKVYPTKEHRRRFRLDKEHLSTQEKVDTQVNQRADLPTDANKTNETNIPAKSQQPKREDTKEVQADA